MFRKIKKRRDFNHIKRYGKRIKGRFYLFNFVRGQKSFAIIVPKRVGHSVKRNYEKRIIRELIRRHVEEIEDLRIVIIRLSKVDGSFVEKAEDFAEIIQKIKHELKG